jgi:hypothetical protein
MKEGGVRSLTDVNVSYKRRVLYLNKELWAERYNEAIVHWGLIKKGIMLWMRPQMIVRQDRGKLRPVQTARERFAWGRLFGSLRAREISAAGRVAYILLSPGIPFLLISRIGLKQFRGGSSWGQFLRTLPHILAMTLIWSIGEFVGSITAR